MITKDDLIINLSRLDEWIRGADQKVSIFLAFQGLVLTLLIPGIVKIVTENHNNISCTQWYLAGFGTLFLLLGIEESISAIIPRLKNKSAKKSLLYFGHIAIQDLSDYKKRLNEVDEDQYKDEVINQIHVLAIIALKKYEHFRNSIVSFFIGFAILVFSYACFIFIYGF